MEPAPRFPSRLGDIPTITEHPHQSQSPQCDGVGRSGLALTVSAQELLLTTTEKDEPDVVTAFFFLSFKSAFGSTSGTIRGLSDPGLGLVGYYHGAPAWV